LLKKEWQVASTVIEGMAQQLAVVPLWVRF
jgi:hypothetical protein